MSDANKGAKAPKPDAGWRDIATAPTDGTKVLVYVPTAPAKPLLPLDGPFVAKYFAATPETGWWSANGLQIRPTHWVELPESPQ